MFHKYYIKVLKINVICKLYHFINFLNRYFMFLEYRNKGSLKTIKKLADFGVQE